MKQSLKYLLLPMVMVMVAGCASKKISSPLSEDRALLFPYGVYKQRVMLTVPEGAGKSGFSGKQFQFNGVVQLKAEQIRVAILSPFGTTVAKIEEDRTTGKIKTEIYADAMKKHESRVAGYYLTLKQMMIAPAKPGVDSHLQWLKVDERGRPLEIRTQGDELNAHFLIEAYDEHGIPERVTFDQLNGGVKVKVEVTGYEM